MERRFSPFIRYHAIIMARRDTDVGFHLCKVLVMKVMQKRLAATRKLGLGIK